MHWINTAGNGSFEPVGDTFTDWYHKHGTTIMYDEGKLLTAGGWVSGSSTTSTNQAFTVDLNGATPVVELTNPMRFARKFQNGVMLPNGEVLVVGGNTSGQKFSDNGAVLVPEIWNPADGSWREGAPMTIPRNYHSIALLLNDGRVLAAGSGYNSNRVPASTHQDGQVYSPPYLFNANGTLATRPAIQSGPGIVETGASFSVATSEPVDYFSLIKMSSTTHGMNTDVRFLKPQFTEIGINNYSLTLHANPNVATPGYWMLFALNAAGVPSVAHVIRVTAVDTRLDNRALLGSVSQSSTLAGGEFAPENAIDGDLSGAATSGSISHTGDEANAWWEIDLGQNTLVDTVRLWNRSDCCAERLSDFYVLVSEQPFSSPDLSIVLAQPGVRNFFFAGAASRQTDFDIAANGRYVRIQKSTPGFLQLAEVQVFADEAITPPAVLRAERGVLADVSSEWQTVTLDNSYVDPVVVATARYTPAQLSAVTRVRNAAGNQFDIRVQNPSDTALAGYGVNYFVVEAGVYDIGTARLEATKFSSTLTDENNSWQGQPREYQQSYVSPVVLGQVMSSNDDDWSVFWASNGSNSNPPSATSLFVGKHVGEDTDTTRAVETIGYVVFESGTGNIGDLDFQAAVGADILEGVVENAPYNYPLNGQYDSAVVSSAAMDGTDGGWPVMVGSQLDGSTLGLGIDEDQIRDTERNRTTDQAAFLAMTSNVETLSVDDLTTSPTASGTESVFSATASGPGPVLYSWSVEGTNTPFSTDNSLSHTFSTPGRHLVTLTVRDSEGNEVQSTFTQLIHLPLTAGTPRHSGSVAEYAARNEIWVVNPDNDSVSVIDSQTQVLLAEVPVSDEPRSLAIAPDGSVWAVSKGAALINVIDPGTYGVTAMSFFDVASQPHGLVIGDTQAYVTLEATGEVLALDVQTRDELGRASVGGRPRHVSLDASGANLLVSQFVTPAVPDEGTDSPLVDDGTNQYGGQVVALDAATLGVIETIVLQHSDRQVSEHSGPGVPNYLGPAIVSPDGTSAWVPSKQDNILAGALRGGQGLTFDQTVRAIASKIELPSRTENFTMRVDLDNASVASHAAFGPYGIHLFTALEGNREVAVIDVFSGVELLRIDTGFAPQGVAVSADGSRLYVHNFMDRSVGIYDIDSLSNSGVVTAAELAVVSTVSSEALAETVLLGKQLFYDARDDRLAALDYMSCASCHNEGSDDGR
ncbi:MAG: galactose oxidase-like domain-containing protein, partial [Pseudomonadota bacterium]